MRIRDVANIAIAITVAISFGLLEAAWTIRGPVNVWLGIFAILLGLAAVTFPRLWRIPALAILEEATHILTVGGSITWNNVIMHWSVNLISANLYVWITFPLITAAGEAIHRFKYGSRLYRP